MRWSELSFDDRTVRQFAGLCLVCLGSLGLWLALVRGEVLTGAALSVSALTLGGLGLHRPRWLRHIYVAWMALVFPIGWLVAHVVLGVLFFGVFTPLALVFRLAGRDVLQRRPTSEQDTYWQPRETRAESKRYLRQF
jgi:hypothetical protein